ncbi:BA14K family protein [Oricola sp.]|uniref:BA14K family protein n=1 Tax=Oricola sp. TaxID=1979950 RepID=UPI003BA91DE5
MFAATIKNTITAIATAATLASTLAVPAANAGGKLVLAPQGPSLCATKPWLCEGGIVVAPPVDPGPVLPPPPKKKKKSGLSKDQMLGLGILGGIVAGAAIANASKPKEVVVVPGNAHLQYCYNRYKSYREWDNSWQPYQGPRRPCISPYM